MSLAPPSVTTSPRSGLQMFQEHLAAGGGPRQPIERLLGIRPIAVSSGRAAVQLTPSPDHHNGAGILHGGVYATVLDNTCAAACYTTVTEGTKIVTTDLTVKYLRSATGDSGPLTCEAEVVNRGRRNVLVQGRMTDGSGRLLAHATCTIMIVD